MGAAMIESALQFETHMTLSPIDFAALASVRTWCESQALKWTHIVLDQGRSPSQPMVTFLGSESLAVQLKRAEDLTRAIQKQGGEVVRVKTEVPFDHDHVGSHYFEHHIKLLLDATCDVDALTAMVVPHAARLSRNARRERADGLLERFVTQRQHHQDRHQASVERDDLLAALTDAGFAILETESEVVLFDSNVELDAGWI